MSALKDWCKGNGFNNSTNISHVHMDGGVMSIPFDRLNDFYEIYISSIKTDKLYVVEQKSDIYNYFIDIDFNGENPLDINTIKILTQHICKTISPTKCIISTSRPKPKNGKIKTGIHMNWPELQVSQTEAILLRNQIVQSLNEEFSAYDWSKFIDPSVYGNIETGSRGSGLRMLYSYKYVKCDSCNGKGCTNCNNRGKKDEPEYIPIFIFSQNRIKTIDSTQHSIDHLWMATVRTNCQEPTKVAKKKPDFTNAQKKSEIVDYSLLREIETFIRTNMVGHGDVRLRNIYNWNENCCLVSSDNKWCENHCKEHSSNHVYFYIHKGNSQIHQRCHSVNEIGRSGKYCKDFRGKLYNLPKKITTQLKK